MSEVTKFYTFVQNNSGGYWDGPRYIIIEASNAKQANEIARRSNEIYFNGCASGHDCSCCGDRWYPVEDDTGSEKPEIWGTPLEEYNSEDYKLIPYKAT